MLDSTTCQPFCRAKPAQDTSYNAAAFLHMTCNALLHSLPAKCSAVHRVLSRKGRGLVNSHDPDKTVSLFGAKGSPLLYPGFSQRHTQHPRSSPSKTQTAYTVFRGKACSSTPLPSKCGGTSFGRKPAAGNSRQFPPPPPPPPPRR